MKYLGLILERRLTWKKYMEAKRDLVNYKLKSMLDNRQKLNPLLDNKLLIYDSVLKPIWPYGIQL